MPTLWPLRKTGTRIGLRIAILIISFSSAATLVITVSQLAMDYCQQKDDLDRRLGEVQVLLPSLAASVWTFNDTQIRLGLRALVNLPDIERAAIATTDGDGHWSEGETLSPGLERTYPLVYDGHGAERHLGTLTVTASYDAIYRRLASRAAMQLLSNGVKTFLVAGFMLFIFRRLVTERLAGLGQRMDALMPELDLSSGQGAPAHLRDPNAAGDEIDSLEERFAGLTSQLALAVLRLRRAEASLREANAGLNRRVQERTADLEAANLSLTRTKKKAEDAAAAERRMRLELRNFLSMVSHEFRLPLSIIAASSQLLSIFPKMEEIAQDEVGKISRAASRLADLIDVCLADERLDAGEGGMQLAETDIGAVVKDLCQEFNARTPGRIDMAPDTGAAPIVGDPALLRIAISNLLDNAIKYSPVASPVTVAVEPEDDGLAIHVDDRGIGIDPDERERIFEKYFRSTKTDTVRGAGLGLHIVRRIAELHGGGVTIQSTPGDGARFTLHLPRTRAGETPSA